MSDRPNNLLRRSLTRIGVMLYRCGLAPLLIRYGRRQPRALLYHAVEAEPGPYTAGLNVTVSPHTFAAHLDYFQRHYRVITPDQLDTAQAGKPPLLITFDDGYDSVRQHALPLLEARGLRACVYVVGRAVEGRLIWVNLLNYALLTHPEEALQTLAQFDANLAELESRKAIISTVQKHFPPRRIEALCQALQQAIPELADLDAGGLYLSKADISRMQARGVSFGFHSADHYNLRRCDDTELARQLDTATLAPLLNSASFAYPYGYFDKRSLRLAGSSFSGPILTVGNNNRAASSRHLDRIEVFSADPAEVFASLEVVEPVISWLRQKTGRVAVDKPARRELAAPHRDTTASDAASPRRKHGWLGR